jgi:hypothetical protein
MLNGREKEPAKNLGNVEQKPLEQKAVPDTKNLKTADAV